MSEEREQPTRLCDHVCQRLYSSEINFTISTFWDGGFDWKLGDECNGFKEEGCTRTFDDAVVALRAAAIRQFPTSQFAKRDHLYE